LPRHARANEASHLCSNSGRAVVPTLERVSVCPHLRVMCRAHDEREAPLSSTGAGRDPPPRPASREPVYGARSAHSHTSASHTSSRGSARLTIAPGFPLSLKRTGTTRMRPCLSPRAPAAHGVTEEGRRSLPPSSADMCQVRWSRCSPHRSNTTVHMYAPLQTAGVTRGRVAGKLGELPVSARRWSPWWTQRRRLL
jgi:hypothetical protein